MKKTNPLIQDKEFDQKFDAGDDVSPFLDVKNAHIHKPVQRINIDFPMGLLRKIDEEARRVGIARTALIKVWVSERPEQLSH